MSLCEAGRCVLATETKRGECVFVWKPDDPRGGGERGCMCGGGAVRVSGVGSLVPVLGVRGAR